MLLHEEIEECSAYYGGICQGEISRGNAVRERKSRRRISSPEAAVGAHL